jgi:hypothetical protein
MRSAVLILLASVGVGACGAEASVDGAPAPEKLATGQFGPTSLAVDATSVYWSTYPGETSTDGWVGKVSLAGGEPEVLVTGQPEGGGSIAVDSSDVYWMGARPLAANANENDGYVNAVMKVGLTGGDAVIVHDNAAGGPLVDAANLYWCGTTYIDGTPVEGVFKSPLNGDATATLATVSGDLAGLAIDPNYVYWVASPNGGIGGSVMRVPIEGGDPTMVSQLDADTMVTAFAADGSNVYWTSFAVDDGRESVMSAPLDGGNPTQLAVLHSAGGLAVDATAVYWLDSDVQQSAVKKLPLHGGAEVTIASWPGFGRALVTDETSVYMTDGSSILKAAK